MRFLGFNSDIVYKLMITLCQIKIAKTSGEYWKIESEYALRNILEKYSRKFLQLKQLKEYRARINKEMLPYEEDFILALRPQSHQLNQVQELSEVKNKSLYPSACLTDSS